MLTQILQWLTADISGFLVQTFFAFMVILMVLDKQKPPLVAGLFTGIALIVLGLGGSFNAPAVAAMSVANGFLWLILAWQRFRQSPQPN